MALDPDVKKMSVFAAGLVVLAIVSVIGIVVLAEFKSAITFTGNCTSDPNCPSRQVNTTVDLFIAGIAVFGTFATILALILIAKIILGLLRGGLDS